MDWMTAEQLNAKRDGEARAIEASRAGKEQLAAAPAPTKEIKKGTLRPELWERCPTCHAPAINPATGKCEMATCETNPSSASTGMMT